ncbi:hypothetical protein HHK36_013865 [Tetracentron sinense]|uniref:Uncharacterized protein n=1 Tax=Tetracentron sinense TaxID=13715 RepID=A0A834ZB84_TETSI|nr:hypothetical protein HHK36_013865 [Tetracentron sinense]
MATPHEKPTLIDVNPPLEEHEQEEEDEEETCAAGRCGCLRLVCIRCHGSNNDERIYLLQQKEEIRETWWVKRVKKLKDLSELLGGPKWKTFIRKIGATYSHNKRRRSSQFQYDPRSYALNFDDGVNWDLDGAHLHLSARLAAPPIGFQFIHSS